MGSTVTALAPVAHTYSQRGLTCIPLRLDEDGLPKQPAVAHYTALRPEDNVRHDWGAAAGIGIVLGRPSGNLAVIDVDDVGLSEFLERRLSAWQRPPLMVRTAREQLHIYVIESRPSWPIDLEVHYQQRRCLVQLLGAGCQVAAPPTPGYQWIDAKAEPLYADSIRDAWIRISLEFHLFSRAATRYSFERRERSRGPTASQIREAMR
jgi:hypothetical protein